MRNDENGRVDLPIEKGRRIMKRFLLTVLAVGLVGCTQIQAGEPGTVPERPEVVKISTPGPAVSEPVVYVEAPKATWGGLFRALVGFPFRVGAAVLRETGDTSAAVVEAGAGYAGAIGGEVVELEK